MRKLIMITAPLSAFALIPMATAQTTNQPPATNAQPKATPSSPRANTTTTPKASSTTNVRIKADRTARKSSNKMRHARNHRKMGTYAYRASGKRHLRHAKLGYRSASHRRHHRVMGYRAASVGCR